MEKTISIIGAGACGILVLNQLVDRFANTTECNAKIFLIEKNGEFGPGMVYGTPLDSHILNMRANSMSADPRDVTHFARWLESYPGSYQVSGKEIPYFGDGYPPRRIFGDYLRDVFTGVLDRADSSGIKIECIDDEAVGLCISNDVHCVTLKENPSILSDYVVLSLGNFPNAILPDLCHVKGFISYPWPIENIMQNVSGKEPVCIIGSGLSAIDCFYTLLEAGQKEKVYFISRNGWLPKVQGVSEEYDLQFISLKNIKRFLTQNRRSRLRLDQIVDLFFKEVEAAEGKTINRQRLLNPSGGTLEILEKDIYRAKNKTVPYQNALNATESFIGDLWNMLSTEDQKRFDSEYKSLWTVYRHPMPLLNAENIRGFIRSGQLEVLSCIDSVCHIPSKNVFSIHMIDRQGGSQNFEVPFIVNATGQGNDVRKFNSSIISDMLSEGIISPHPSGGINVEYHTGRVINRKGGVSKSLFAIGELTRGVHFFTNGINPCGHRAVDIIDCMFDKENAGHGNSL